MAKTLCDWKREEIFAHADKLARLTSRPGYFCRKCARVSNSKKVLCKPARLPVVQLAKS